MVKLATRSRDEVPRNGDVCICQSADFIVVLGTGQDRVRQAVPVVSHHVAVTPPTCHSAHAPCPLYLDGDSLISTHFEEVTVNLYM